MADVFVSYARTAAQQARQVTAALEALGYSIWIDEQLPAHGNYSHIIEDELNRARSVLVLWSAEAAKSDWVMDEAERGRERHKLVQASLDKTRLPMPFGRIQCADLSGWSGDPQATGWQQILSSIADLTGTASSAAPTAPTHNPVAMPAEPLLAVLPFDNASSDRELSYFSDGVSDEIRETIARGADLKVIGRGSSFQFRGAEKSAAHVAAQVKATHVLDGSVQRSGQKLRITAELVDCATETTVWSSRFDRDLSDVFALQDEIASAVAQALRVAITLHAQPLAVDPATYDLYLAAREASFRLTDEAGLIAAFENFQRVVGAAPVFARAWAELARTGSLLWRYHEHGLVPQLTPEFIANAADTALKLDPGLGIAYLALSELERFDHFVERGVLHGQALTYAPGDAAVLAGAAMFRSEVGRLGEAVELAAQAARIDPMFGVAEGLYAGLLTGVGRHAEAQAVLDRLLAAKPDLPSRTHNALYDAACAADWDRFDDLVTQAKLNGAYDKDIAEYVTYWTAIRTDDWVAMQRYLHQIAAEFAPGRLGQNDAIQNAVALGDVELAFDFVQRYALEHDESRLPTARFFSFAGTMFMWGNRPMMRDIRFIQLCHKIGLCKYWVETGNWPDCAGEGRLPYDFKAECRRLAAE